MASEEEVVRFIFNGANEMAELMYQLIKWALERREKGRDDGRRDPSKISGRIAPEDAASFAADLAAAGIGAEYVAQADGGLVYSCDAKHFETLKALTKGYAAKYDAMHPESVDNVYYETLRDWRGCSLNECFEVASTVEVAAVNKMRADLAAMGVYFEVARRPENLGYVVKFNAKDASMVERALCELDQAYGHPQSAQDVARAVAGEAGVPFFSISGSDFVEMFVGVGASRVRDLFKEAAKVAPCIVFIDEIDTIGKSRDNRMGGNDEREQTLNQLLAEMDGFDPTKGIILLAATNRPEVLDQALLRPGRFDRRITIDRPNLAGRIATLQVHTRNIKLAEDVNLKKVALATAGCVGADLANLVNEAALRAVRKGRKLVTQEDLLAAFELVIAGTEKKGSVLTEFEKKLVAYHEVGHAMVAYKQKNTEPVQKITIVPHTQGSLGYTLLMPEEDKTELRTRDELMAKIMVSMGGRAAEEVVMNTMTNGASQDIQDATNVARNMVAMFGMSEEFGMMALASRRSQYLDGGYGIDCAQDTAAAMDRAVRDLIDACYKKAVEILSHSREDMDKVVEYLLEKETITGAEMVAILEGRDPALADNFPDPDGKGTVGPPAEPVSDPIPLSGGEPQPPNGGGMEFGPEGKPKE